ncbi:MULTISPECIES: DODA-type extradiol aromatic ring-opening family dioxygenase [Burkholderia]|jgi:2-aminophenol/2-amino-5-chlorophenol 1,6-dioxygenase alpha subunit|uniref:tRNA U-34 5-methylaminomethyl-2-thiouridine biosynthesis protein n=2 Tax=Burkholderia contaminans TaxID=488447 RepID=A0A1E3FV68_9BURK|nr:MULTISPECIES: tRNA U-34 5-methylaminomethyl-2-thiouridine biosynthesis protein [Burkholderia]UTP20864.1 tRNA U-34 5-methylaminomethyl-2-thiouridine biosynthesis protein [Burkholderia sp. FXe9]KKL40764.1 tRNA U-34 5-methylaminomethyl-2-thiouridine biosynthesis protein [Burkholderia contaminans LMG 23361]MBA9832777.1 tRNA U-34 5-methylaminomethyl-2-thiouridine biosynthesis protein [Burkholderia contaminans]MBA9837932.1 tRNA U-34 5-methylaminomethyl-2-thiouridine biosynthesis protein [Burkholde
MTIVSAFLVPGSPLPQLRPDIAPWGRLREGMARAGKALAASKPDCVLVYSTQWFAVLDQLWITRERSTGLHVDENWHEFGEQAFDIHSDSTLVEHCVQACNAAGIKTRGVDYDQFPIDTGTITAATLMGFGTADIPVAIAANNLYHSAETTEQLGAIAAATASDKRVAVVGIGGLSNGMFRENIDLGEDHIFAEADDKWNRRVLALMEIGHIDVLRATLPQYASEARPDMALKHFYWLLGAMNGGFKKSTVHEYAPLYGSGGAVVEFSLQ